MIFSEQTGCFFGVVSKIDNGVNIMKKGLSWLLILIMLLSCFVCHSLAEEEENEGTVEIVSDPQELTGILDEAEEEPFAPDNLEKAIFGKDDRITVRNPSSYPYSAIALMDIKFKCGCHSQATGYMVGKKLLLTAAHCVVCTKHGQWAKTIDFYFGYKSKKNYLYKYSGYWRAWAGNTFKNKKYTMVDDYACIRLLGKNVGDYTGWFGSRWNVPVKTSESEYYYVAGYRDGKLKYATGKVKRSGSNYEYLNYEIDQMAGNSGGPIFDMNNRAVGIIIAENKALGNFGYVLNSDVRQVYDTADAYRGTR